jgi:hypothetical protein
MVCPGPPANREYNIHQATTVSYHAGLCGADEEDTHLVLLRCHLHPGPPLHFLLRLYPLQPDTLRGVRDIGLPDRGQRVLARRGFFDDCIVFAVHGEQADAG